MADVMQYSFSHSEVATALVKQQGLHDGRWKLALNVGFTATSLGNDPNTPGDLKPALITVIESLLLVKTDEVSSLSVDASEVNPK